MQNPQRTLTKPIGKLGNAAGVLLPKSWLGGQAQVTLIKKPLNIKEDLLNILAPYLEDIKGIYLVGSHARSEATEESDVDVLAITNTVAKPIKQKPYEIIMITEQELKERMQTNIIPLLPMIKEAKPIINKTLLQPYKKTKITKQNLKRTKERMISALKIVKGLLNLDKTWPSNAGDAVAYSLVLNLRTLEIVKALKKNQGVTKKELLKKIKTLSGSTEAYQGYRRVKNQKKEKESLPIKEAEALQIYIEKEVKNI